MNKQVRLNRLLEMVTDRGCVTVDEIVAELGVSAATVRRDLDTLATRQLLTRSRGGAVANTVSGEIPLGFRANRKSREKQCIARAAASMVDPGGVVGFSGGTTATAAAYEVGVVTSARSAFNEHPLTVVTNAVNIANDLTLRPNIRLVVIGGVARSRSYELIGPLAETIVDRIRIGTLFLGVDSIDCGHGLFTHNDGEAEVNARLVAASQRTIVLADHTKIEASAFAKICDFSDVDMVITDSGISAENRALLEENTEVFIARD